MKHRESSGGAYITNYVTALGIITLIAVITRIFTCIITSYKYQKIFSLKFRYYKYGNENTLGK